MAKKNRYQRAKPHRPPQIRKLSKKLRPRTDHAVVAAWKEAMKKGTFLTPKHDEDYIATPNPKWLKKGRSVLSSEAKKNWDRFLDSNEYDIVHYDQPKHVSPSSGCFTVTPHNNKFLDVPGSGIPPKQLDPTNPLDTFVVVCGPKIGWHIYADSSARIGAQVASGMLVSGRKL